MEQKNDAKRKSELDILFGSNSDIDFNIMLFGEAQNYSFNNYYILNKEWYDRYIQSLISGSKENLFLLSDFLFPDLKEKKVDIKNELNIFLLPTNFVLINEKSANMISEYFEANEEIEIKKLCHEVLIYGECIVIKSNLKPNVLYICLKKNEVKKNEYDMIYENYISYIFQFKSKEDMENEIKCMISSNFKDYLKFKKFDNNLNILEIYNDNTELMGNIIYNSNENIDLSSTLNLLQKNRVLEKPKGSEKIISKMNSYFKSIILGLSRFEKLIQGFKSITNSNRNLTLTKNFFFFLEGISKGDMSDNSIEKEFINSIKTQNHENIINEIFDKLDSEMNPNNKNIPINFQLNQTNQITAEKNFKLIHKNPSFIENLCFITLQKKILCEKCKSTKYQYYYNNYFTIDLNEKENNIQKPLKDILLGVKNTFEKCNDCNNNKCKTEIRVDEFPPILIVIIKGDNNKKFTLKNNLIIHRDYKPFYKLSCCVEENTNNFFYLEKKAWFKFDINININVEENKQEIIEGIKPSILFFNAQFKEPRFKNMTQVNQINNNNIPVQNFNSNNNNNLFNNNINMNNFSSRNNNQINMNNNNNFNMNNNQPNIINNYFSQNNNQFFKKNNNNQFNNNQFNKFSNNNFSLDMAKSKSDNFINNKMDRNNQFNMNINNKNIINNQFNMNINNNINNNPFNMNINNNINNMNWNMNNQNANIMNNNLLINQNNNNNFNNNNLLMNQNNNNFRNQEKPKPKGTIIFITFTFEKNKEQIYLDADDGESFENILLQLEDKYNWLRKIINRTYFLESKPIVNHKLTLKQLGIVENSDISIRA